MLYYRNKHLLTYLCCGDPGHVVVLLVTMWCYWSSNCCYHGHDTVVLVLIMCTVQEVSAVQVLLLLVMIVLLRIMIVLLLVMTVLLLVMIVLLLVMIVLLLVMSVLLLVMIVLLLVDNVVTGHDSAVTG